VFSVPPLLILVISVASLAFGRSAVENRMLSTIGGLIGSHGARAIQDVIASAHADRHGAIATALGVAMLLFGASGVFGQLQDALNTIWEVKPKPGRGLRGIVEDRVLYIKIVMGTGFLLRVCMMVIATTSGLSVLMKR